MANYAGYRLKIHLSQLFKIPEPLLYIIKDNPEIYIELLPNIIAGALDRAALIRENVAAEKALRIAHDQLEERVSERTKELYLSQIRLENILNLAPEAVMAIDDSFAIELFNNSAEYIFGYDASAVIGRSVEALFPHGLPKICCKVQAFAQAPNYHGRTKPSDRPAKRWG